MGDRGGNDTKLQMHTGQKPAPPIGNPYVTSSNVPPQRSTPSRAAPGPPAKVPTRRPPPVPTSQNYEQTFKSVPFSGPSSKMHLPPKVPPIGSSSPRPTPGKLPQIDSYNKMDTQAKGGNKLPPVQIKKPYR